MVKAVLSMKFVTPTEVQQKAIPIALQRQDIMMKAKTGSGKTLAFVLPVLQQVLVRKASLPPSERNFGPKALILAPSQELIYQIGNVMNDLLKYADDAVSGLALIQQGLLGMANEKPRLEEGPDVVICTPTRLAAHLDAGNVSLCRVEHVVVDEADLLMAEDYEADIKTIVRGLQSVQRRPQMVMCSATLNPNTAKVQHWFLMHRPRLINLGEDGDGGDHDTGKLTEYLFQCQYRNDKFLVMYGLLRLDIITGKCIIFCASLNFGYRLKLFLERFLIRTAVLNPMLPVKSRQDIISKFNKGVITHLVTTDRIDDHDDRSNIMNYWVQPAERAIVHHAAAGIDVFGPAYSATGSVSDGGNPFDSGSMRAPSTSMGAPSDRGALSDVESVGTERSLKKEDGDGDGGADSEWEFEDAADDVMSVKSTASSRRSARSRSTLPLEHLSREERDDLPLLEAQGKIAYRGVDFREVAAVINFTAPRTESTYIHRAGRTARGGNYGVCITLCSSKEWDTWFRHNVYNERVRRDAAGQIIEHRIQPLPMSLEDLESFRYRCDSVRKAITPKLIKIARLNELRMEILNAKRLHSQFRERTRAFELKRHDSMLQPHELIKAHMAAVPRYMTAGSVLDQKPTRKDRHESGFRAYQKVFGKLPPTAERARQKKKFKLRLRRNPELKAKFDAKRRGKLKAKLKGKYNSKRNKRIRLHEQHGLKYLKGSTIAGSKNAERPKVMVFKKPTTCWRDPLRNKFVARGVRKPSMRGLSRSQIKIMRKRMKQKKLAHRRK